jgi:transposase
MECYVGLDVHSKASVFVIQDGHGQVQAQGEMPTTPEGFRCWHEGQRLPAGTPVALETGTVAFFVARELTALGCAPIVVDAREVRLKAQRPTQKSDRRDAFESHGTTGRRAAGDTRSPGCCGPPRRWPSCPRGA